MPQEPRYNADAVQQEIDRWNGRRKGSARIGGKEARLIHALLKGRG